MIKIILVLLGLIALSGPALAQQECVPFATVSSAAVPGAPITNFRFVKPSKVKLAVKLYAAAKSNPFVNYQRAALADYGTNGGVLIVGNQDMACDYVKVPPDDWERLKLLLEGNSA